MKFEPHLSGYFTMSITAILSADNRWAVSSNHCSNAPAIVKMLKTSGRENRLLLTLKLAIPMTHSGPLSFVKITGPPVSPSEIAPIGFKNRFV